MTDTIMAWHFVGDHLRNGRPIPKDGVWLRHDGPVEICRSGLHASRRPWHALEYAPGAVLCYVECRGDIVEQSDKLVCRERRILTRADLTETLRFFARMQALSVIHLWPHTPPDVVLDYLMTGEESVRDAAWAAAMESGMEDGWGAAKVATRSAAWAASRMAAWVTALVAANSAAWSAARDAAGEEFDTLVHEQFGVAA